MTSFTAQRSLRSVWMRFLTALLRALSVGGGLRFST
jgi:hypothetical protein